MRSNMLARMKPSKLYSNKPDIFAPVEFTPELNVVLAEIRLPENGIGGAVRNRVGVPPQDPMIAGIGDQHATGAGRGERMRPAKRIGGHIAAPVLFARTRIGLSEDDVGGLARFGYSAMPDEHSTIAGVGDIEVPVDQGDAERPVERRCSGIMSAVRLDGRRIRLADHVIGWGCGPRRHPIPDQ